MLDLPKAYGRIHSTFHVSLLEPYTRRPGMEPPPPIEVDGEEHEYLMDTVLNARVTRATPPV